MRRVRGVRHAERQRRLEVKAARADRQAAEGAQQALNTGTFSRLRPADIGLDEMNALIAEESRARPASDVLAEADARMRALGVVRKAAS